MDRSDAATALFLWQFEGERDLVQAAGRDGGRSLLSIVESIAPPRPVRPTRVREPPPPIDFFGLEEERAVEALRERLRSLASVLRPGEQELFEARLAPPLMPEARIIAIQAELDRVAIRRSREVLQRELEERLVSPVPRRAPRLAAVLLFARDGRLLAGEGDTSALDTAALSALVSRGEPGSTWSLNHAAGVLVGHLGKRAALVAVFRERPSPGVGGTLRVSLISLEQRERLVNALRSPASQPALMAYVRAVRLLLQKNA